MHQAATLLNNRKQLNARILTYITYQIYIELLISIEQLLNSLLNSAVCSNTAVLQYFHYYFVPKLLFGLIKSSGLCFFRRKYTEKKLSLNVSMFVTSRHKYGSNGCAQLSWCRSRTWLR